MSLQRKTFRWLTLGAVVMTVTGCGGINASKSVSPLDFILPGFMHNNRPELAPPAGPVTNTVTLVAQAR